MRRALEPLQLGERLTTAEVSVMAGWWVFIPPLKNRADVDRKLAELEQLGVPDYYAIEAPGAMQFAISLASLESSHRPACGGADAFL